MMKESTTLRYNFDSFDIIIFIKENFKTLAILSLAGAIISAIVSLTITEKFKSTVIMFPAPSTSISKTLLTDNLTSKNVATFGEEEEVEQLLQILNSDEIRDYIMKKYNLMEHYEIKDDDKYKVTNFIKTYNSNISCHRTEFMSIEIEVLDKDKILAADIANDIAAYMDTVMFRMEFDRGNEAMKIVENEYFTLQKQVNKLKDSLSFFRSKGVMNYESQAEVFNKSYAEALAKNDMKGADRVKEKLDTLAKYGGGYVALRDFLIYQTEQLTILKNRYTEAKVDATAKLPHKFIVNKAFPADKKTYPIRWLIVVLSTIGTGIVAALGLMILEIIKGKQTK